MKRPKQIPLLHLNSMRTQSLGTSRGLLSTSASSGSPDEFGHVADRILVLWPGVKPVPLRWESRVQDIGPPETSRLHIISNGRSSPRDLHLNTKTQLHSTTSRLQCWIPYVKQLARQPLAERLPKIIIRSQTPQNTPLDTVLPTRKTRSSLIHQNTGTSPLHQETYTTH